MNRRALRVAVVVAALVAGTLLPVRPAHALFHLMKVSEVFAGTEAQPSAQFVELQMFANQQRFVETHQIVIFGPTGAEAGTFTFASDLNNGTSQRYVLIATPEAEALFGLAADLQMTAVMDPSGGKACFRENDGPFIDCASWGNYTGDPFGSGTPFNAAGGLTGDQSMTRRTSGGSNASGLDAGDDTNDSAADFEFQPPTPTNNAGQTGALPPPIEPTIHERAVTLTLEGRRRLVATGQVTSTEPFEACHAGVPVRLQKKKRSGGWKTVSSGSTDTAGSYRLVADDRSGTYRAKAPELIPSEEHHCLVATSPKRKRS